MVARHASALLLVATLGMRIVHAQSTASPSPVWRVDTLSIIRFGGGETLFLGGDSLVATVSYPDRSLVVAHVCACRPVRIRPLPKAIARASNIGGVAISGNGQIWIASSAAPEVYLLEESRGKLELVESFRFGDEVLAIASISNWGENGAVVRVFNSESKAFGLLEQRVFGIRRGTKARELLNLSPYVPLTQTRVKVGSAERTSGVRWIAQPFRADRVIALGADGAFAIGDSANYAVVVGTPTAKVTRTFGDRSPGRPLTVQERAEARVEIERISRALHVRIESLPWGVPVTRQALGGVWLNPKRLVMYAPSSEHDRIVDEFDLLSGQLRQRVKVPAASQFIFAGLLVDTWAMGMIKVDGGYVLARVGAVPLPE